MSRAELMEWAAAYDIEPWGELREDARHGIACATIDNMIVNIAHGARGDRQPSDYMPKFTAAQRVPTSAEESKKGFASYVRGQKRGPAKRRKGPR